MKSFKFRLMTICKTRLVHVSADIDEYMQCQAIARKARRHEVMKHTAGMRSVYNVYEV
jgi:hypothetical protein